MGDIALACHTASWGPEEFIQALGEIAACGYKGIEAPPSLVEAYEDRPLVLREILEQNRLSLVGVVSPCGPLSTLSLEEEIERNLNTARFLRSMGARYLVIYAPTVKNSDELDDEDYAMTADAISEIGLQALEMGIKTCLHPQFGTICEGPAEIKRLLELTHSRGVGLCLDTGHFQAISLTPASFYRDHHQRVSYIHFKDLRRVNKPRATKKSSARRRRVHGKPVYCELGKGTVNFNRLVDYMIDYDYEGWVTIELDPPVNTPAARARASLEYSHEHLDLVI